MLELKLEKRENPKKDASIPAIFYGKGVDSTSVSVDKGAFKKVFTEAGESTVVTLKGEDGEHDALIHDVQFDVVTDEPIHVDFYVFEKGKKIEVEVPLEFIGKSPAVDDLGGILVKAVHELPIEAQPKDLPHDIKVDISALVDLESVITAKDLVLPEGVELAVDPDESICSVAVPKEEEEDATGDVDLDSIEVEEKGKKEEEGEAPAEESKEE
ncbi:MAG: 50S ribosomal protein L25 [Candidatus Pacebacteria bacterium]|nr:50S ribosomal protein L25 [Candidatus Paceibacterota bacterium]